MTFAIKLFFFAGVVYFLLKFGEALGNFRNLLIEKFLKMLSMTFDFDDDISIIIFDFIDAERPIQMYKFFSFRMNRLKEHISFITNLMVPHKLLKDSFHLLKLKVSTQQLNDIRFSNQLRSLKEQHEVDFQF